jgi:hypothetical protein
MHDCPVCGEACDCDGEDHFNAFASEECDHRCEQDYDASFEEDGLEFGDWSVQCRKCGCTNRQACPGGCVWATPDLCSRCV